MNIRQTIQDTILAGLAATSTGFNARLLALALDYGITVFGIDFTRGSSDNFLEAYVDGISAVERSQIKAFPAIVVYSSEAIFTGQEKGRGFSGSVQFHIDAYLRFRFRDDGESGMESSNTESLANAVEDALLSVFHQSAFAWPTGVIYNRAFHGGREQVMEYADGYLQRVAIQMLFEVRI
jgi:hypothetical protein